MKRTFFAALICALLPFAANALEKVQEVTTTSGLKVWLIEDHALPLVTVKLTFPASGSAYDPKGREGLAFFASQLLDEGAGDMDSLAFHRALEGSAIRLTTDGGEDRMTVGVQTLSEYKGEAVRLLNLALTRPRFDAEAVERIRASIESDLREMNSNPTYLASKSWKEAAFAGHPYMPPRRGTPESVAAIKREDLAQFAKDHLFAGGAPLIAVVGDVTADEIRKWPFPAPVAHEEAKLADAVIPDGGATPVLVPMDVPQTVVQASLPGVSRDDPRYYADFILVHILGGNSLTSRLGSEIRNKRGLAYYVDANLETMDHASYMGINFATRSSETNAALDIFHKEIASVAVGGVTEEELKEAKSYLTGSFPLQIESQDALADFLLAMQHYNLGKDYLEKRNALMQAVTLQQVNAVAKDMLSHTPLIVMVGESAQEKK